MGESGWFAIRTELSWISNYHISLIEIQSKLKTLSRSQAIVYGRTHGRMHGRTTDTTPWHKLKEIIDVELELTFRSQNKMVNIGTT